MNVTDWGFRLGAVILPLCLLMPQWPWPGCPKPGQLIGKRNPDYEVGTKCS